MKVYVHPKCSTCKKALNFLDEAKLTYEAVDITQRPPSKAELGQALQELGSARRLFNTSGQKYRSLGLKEKLDTMSEAEALNLLASDGMLVKRPFLVSEKRILTGFRLDDWQTI